MLSRAISSWGRLFGLGQAKPTSPEERRAWGRISCDIETSCHPAGVGEHERLSARVCNVSRSGINLVVPRSFQPGELLSVTLPGTAEEDDSEVLVCVVRCGQTESAWQLGCAFSTPLNDGDLMRFSTERGPAPSADQRAWVRFPCPAQVSFTVVGSPDSSSTSASVVNISGNGIALQVKAPLAVGELLSIELRRAGELVCTTLGSVVRTTVERNGDRIAGCNFIRALPDEQIQLLL